jgi:mono/diheme cytochrome c family protein
LCISPVTLNLKEETQLEIETIGRGSYLVNSAGQCARCHSRRDYRDGGDPHKGEPEQIDTAQFLAGDHLVGDRIPSTNLTPARVNNGLPAGLTESQFIQSMRTGISPKTNRLLLAMRWPEIGMMSEADLRAMYAYLKRIPPVEREVPVIASEFSRPRPANPCHDLPTDWQIGLCISPVPINVREVSLAEIQKIGRGSYLVNSVGQCGVCHTCDENSEQYPPGGNPFRGEPEGITRFMAGSCLRARIARQDSKPSANLTPASINDGKPAGLDEDEFVKALQTGRVRGCELGPQDPSCIHQVLPWPYLGKMSESDLRAIYAYLKRIPPIEE